MLSICTFKWGNKYSLEHVRKLRHMLARNLTIPWEFVLISDDPEDAKIEDRLSYRLTRWLPLWNEMRDTKLCGVRLVAFAPWMREFIGPRFAWVDLDVVITGNVDSIFSRREEFIALSTPQGPLAYNGSLVMMDAGARRAVYADWSRGAYGVLPAHYAALGMGAGGESDEGWMTLKLGPDEARFNGGWGRRDDGIYFFRHDLAHGRNPLPKGARMVILNGRANDPSNATAQALPWVREHWR